MTWVCLSAVYLPSVNTLMHVNIVGSPRNSYGLLIFTMTCSVLKIMHVAAAISFFVTGIFKSISLYYDLRNKSFGYFIHFTYWNWYVSLEGAVQDIYCIKIFALHFSLIYKDTQNISITILLKKELLDVRFPLWYVFFI